MTDSYLHVSPYPYLLHVNLPLLSSPCKSAVQYLQIYEIILNMLINNVDFSCTRARKLK